MPTPEETQTQDPNQIQELTTEQTQAIWNEEAAKRAPGYTPLADAATETQDDKAADGTSKEEQQPAAAATTGDKPADDGKAKPAADTEDPVAKRLKTLEDEIRRSNGRIAAMQSEQDRAKAAATKAAPTTAQQVAALKSPDKWTALKSEFPEWGEAFEEFHRANATPGMSPEAIEQAITDRVAANARVVESARIERKHPGWQSTVASEEFVAWRKTQDEAVNALGASDLAEDAIEMLDLFSKRGKPAQQDTSQQRKTRLAAATQTPRSGRSTPTPRDDSELTQEEIWNQEAAQRAERKKAAQA